MCVWGLGTMGEVKTEPYLEEGVVFEESADYFVGLFRSLF